MKITVPASYRQVTKPWGQDVEEVPSYEIEVDDDWNPNKVEL